MLLGAHMSTSGGFCRAIERGREAGCEAVQIFVKSNMRWFGKAPEQKDLERFGHIYASQKRVKRLFAHAGYLINIAAPNGANRDNSIKSLVQEIEFSTLLGLPFVVLHPGAHLGGGEKAGVRLAAKALDAVFVATRKSKVRIALENTAGQGSCLGAKLEHLAEIIGLVKESERLGICIDTAHLFAAGYDIRMPRGWNAVINEIDGLLGLKRILAFHLNDSKTGLGSRVDRHEHIGRGQIGADGFRAIVCDRRFAKHPGCLETPKSDDLHEDVENLATLRELAATARKN